VDYPHPEWTPIEGGSVTLGKPPGFPSFGWDNEYGAKTLEVKVRGWGREWREGWIEREGEQSSQSLRKTNAMPIYIYTHTHKNTRMKTPVHTTNQAFEAGKHKVTNGQFYQFVAEGGYFDKGNWSVEGWGWRCFRNVRHPPFWVRYVHMLVVHMLPPCVSITCNTPAPSGCVVQPV
jgi:formylglycine-generating enzyme required for sulfatase activity